MKLEFKLNTRYEIPFAMCDICKNAKNFSTYYFSCKYKHVIKEVIFPCYDIHWNIHPVRFKQYFSPGYIRL